MKLYFLIIGAAVLLISAVNIAVGVASWYYVILSAVFSVAMLFAIDGLIAIAIKLTPDRRYGIDSRYFDVSKRETELYVKLGVRKWKDKVWELGGVGGFSKKELIHPDSAEYIEKFIIECNKGVVTHRLSYPAGFLIMLMLPSPLSLTVALPCAIVNLYLNILPTIVLRYNTPKLKILLKRLKKKQDIKA